METDADAIGATTVANRPLQLGCALACFAPCERGRMVEADATDERISMPMCQVPFGALATIDLGDAKRPVLRRQAADLDRLVLDHRQDHHVGGAVGLHDVLLEYSILEEAPHRLAPFTGHVRAP